ncbi:MAG: antitoxin VapB family protein [bacterium]
MRTTIEIDDEVRAALIRRASERGERGYSDLINEMLRRSLGIENGTEREARARRIEALAGSFSEEQAERMEESIRESRTRWRTES